MKKSILISGLLILSLCLGACNKSSGQLDTDKAQENKVTIKEETPKEEKAAEDMALEDQDQAENDDMNFDQASPMEQLRILMRDSDYISQVELASTADKDLELRILANYKGNLSNIEFDTPSNLSPNKEYLIFYHDDEEGRIVPSHGSHSFVALDEEDTSVLDLVKETYNYEDPEDPKTDQEEAPGEKTNN
ncbi:MAG: hypothetical protein Q4E37_06865 [Tissierellia bacterium]|nr:hypothetical protein [Tissierellia bacterium]